MLFIAQVEGTYGVHFVRLMPTGFRFELNTRPRPSLGTSVTVTLVGLAAVNAESLEAWRRRHAPTGELAPAHYRPTTVGDLMDAVNAQLFLGIARQASADTLAAFALDRGGVLLAEIRADLATGADPTSVTGRARRFAAILAIDYAVALLDDLAKLHAVEHLMGLEHAVVQWIRATTEPPSDELSALARQLPGDRVSAGISKAWFAWWWRLARTCTRGDLRTIVEAAVELARRECGATARDTCDEAARMLDRCRIATTARMWAGPPGEVDLASVARDDNDAHYAAYMALTHAAHAIAAALREDLDAGEANRHAMELVAERALEVLRTSA